MSKYIYPLKKGWVQKSQDVRMSHTDWQHMHNYCPSRQRKESHMSRAPTWINTFLYASTWDRYRKRKKYCNKIRHTTAKPTNQPEISENWKGWVRGTWSSPTHLLYVWVLAEYRVLLFFVYCFHTATNSKVYWEKNIYKYILIYILICIIRQQNCRVFSCNCKVMIMRV